MNPKAFLFIAFLIIGNLSFGQPNQNKEIYPETYTFEKATHYELKGEYETALWFYINLFPDNKPKVEEKVRVLAVKLDTLDMNMLIQKSFAIYSSFDPEISTFENIAPTIDIEKLKRKGAWADELSVKIAEPGKLLSSASEYNFRSIEKFKAKDYLGTLFDLNRAIEMDPTGEYYYNRGFTKSMLNDYKGAIEDYDKAIEFKYKLAGAFFERAFCKDMQADLTGAIADYTSAIVYRNDNADAYNNRGFVYYKQKDYKKAITDFDEAIKLKENYKIAWVNRAFAKKDSKNIKGACADWQKALDLGYTEAQTHLDKYCK